MKVLTTFVVGAVVGFYAAIMAVVTQPEVLKTANEAAAKYHEAMSKS